MTTIKEGKKRKPNYSDAEMANRLLLSALKMNDPELYRRLKDESEIIRNIQNKLKNVEDEYTNV